MTNKEITAYEEMEKRYADGWWQRHSKEKCIQRMNDFFLQMVADTRRDARRLL